MIRDLPLADTAFKEAVWSLLKQHRTDIQRLWKHNEPLVNTNSVQTQPVGQTVWRWTGAAWEAVYSTCQPGQSAPTPVFSGSTIGQLTITNC